MVFILVCAALAWVALLSFVVVLCHVTKQADKHLAAGPQRNRRTQGDRRVRNLAVVFERRVGVSGRPPWRP